jgi:hypothetical protein
MYKWVDEKGVTHFTDQPPPDDKKASRVAPKVAPGNPEAYDPNAWKVREAESRRRQAERGKQERADDKTRQKREQACERARTRLAFLKNSTRIFRDNPDGSRTYLDDKEREAEAAEARQQADEHCR